MAKKDHSLDDKIIKAAQTEFLNHGFQKASLHKIAERAGISTGALYTRYQNKDDLFCSLLSNLLKEIQRRGEPIQRIYEEAKKSCTPVSLIYAIKEEEKLYMNLLFEYYDECVLFFCKGEGSSIHRMTEEMMEKKSKETVAYLKSISKKNANLDGIELIMNEMFRYYRQILYKQLSKEEAMRCMETVELFLEAGWRALFDMIL